MRNSRIRGCAQGSQEMSNPQVNTDTETLSSLQPGNIPAETSSECAGSKVRKSIHIDHEIHRKFTILVRLLVENGNEDLTVGDYAGAIIKDFMEKHKEKINTLYRKDRGDLL